MLDWILDIGVSRIVLIGAIYPPHKSMITAAIECH